MNSDPRRLLEARWRVHEITRGDLHRVADDLLSAGEDDDVLIRLFSLDGDQLRWEGDEVFEELLRVWGGGAMGESEAVDLLVYDISVRLLEGGLTPLEATRYADKMWTRTGYVHFQLLDWQALHEELGWLDRSGRSSRGRERLEVEADVMMLARTTVQGHPA